MPLDEIESLEKHALTNSSLFVEVIPKLQPLELSGTYITHKREP